MRTCTCAVLLLFVFATAHAQSLTRRELQPASPAPATDATMKDDHPAVKPADDASPSVEISASAASSPSPPPIQTRIEAANAREALPETTFRSDARSIFVRWSGRSLPAPCIVRIAWIAEDVGDLVAPNFIVDQNETHVETAAFGARFTISRPADGWAAGKYRVDLYVNDELKDTLGVTISD